MPLRTVPLPFEAEIARAEARGQEVSGEVYQGSTPMNDHMSGDFPVLKPGANAISWTGTVTQVVVRPNWRYL